jgi:hypothetical protein
MQSSTRSTTQDVDRRSLIGASDARPIMSVDRPPLLQSGQAESEHLTRRTGPNHDYGSTKPSAGAVRAAHATFVAGLAGNPPQPISLDTDAIDLEDRADHLSKVFSALSVYLAVLLDDTGQNLPGGLDLRDAEGVLADLAADLTGAIQRAADSMAGWLT